MQPPGPIGPAWSLRLFCGVSLGFFLVPVAIVLSCLDCGLLPQPARPATTEDLHRSPEIPAVSLSIRPEEPADSTAIRRVLEAAFPTAAEACLVDSLRAGGHLVISLVAEDATVAGHIAFSPVRTDGEAVEGIAVGLAPVAVLPDRQGCGIGSRLVREGLAACERAGYGLVVVLGEPAYYRRFGFDRADRRRLENEYGADEAFMVLELREGAIPGRGGVVRYGPEFAEFSI